MQRRVILKKKLAALAALAAVFALLTLLGAGPVGRRFIEFARWTEAQGIYGYLFFIGLCVLFFIPALPEWLLAFAAGVVFGLWRGTLLAAAGVAVGSAAAFVIGRYLARGLAEKIIARYPRLHRLNRALGRNSFLVVFLSRLSPAFPYSIMNYVFSLSAIPLRKFFLGTLLGSPPLIFFYAYLGNLVRTGLVVFEDEAIFPRFNALLLPGLAVTVIVVWLMARAVHKTLSRMTAEESGQESPNGSGYELTAPPAGEG